jgi:hypothetical protein
MQYTALRGAEVNKCPGQGQPETAAAQLPGRRNRASYDYSLAFLACNRIHFFLI